VAKTLLIGSGNRDKAAELEGLLHGTAWVVKTLCDFPEVPEPEETETTFEGNALLKARYYGGKFGVACVADDSGIEVEALGGAPGVYSARYAGANCTYDDNNRKLLAALNDVPAAKRRARFVCCAAFVDCDGMEHIELGTVEGFVAPSPRGSNGFGYDPIFVPSGFEQTFGELNPLVKSSVSHRGEAFGKMSAWLAERVAAAH
jgi:XTP/dITP diphosphohydrolase